MRFENIIYVYSKSLFQPKYEYLRMLFKPLKQIGYYESDNEDKIVSPKDIKPNSILIFDDIVCCNQNIVNDWLFLSMPNILFYFKTVN